MVKGLDKFREYFKDYSGSYVIIGGTACDIAIGEAGLKPRATKDIDIILIVEALSIDFVRHFWKFIKDGEYADKEKNEDERKYYRFMKPAKADFPFQLELFSRKPDIMHLEGAPHLTPIPVEENLSSLSAILLNDTYYQFTIEHSFLYDGVRIAKIEALVALKAKAFLDLRTRKGNGENVSENEIRKHKADVFRLALLLSSQDKFALPEEIDADITIFLDSTEKELPDPSIFKEMEAGKINPQEIFVLLSNAFKQTQKSPS